jgi:predicted negative regulator of RcsB-dependent stress response
MSAARNLSLFTGEFERKSEFERTAEQRDMAAYRALGAMTAAIVFCRQDDPKSALHILTTALQQYERADSQLQEIKKGENTPCRSSQQLRK